MPSFSVPLPLATALPAPSGKPPLGEQRSNLKGVLMIDSIFEQYQSDFSEVYEVVRTFLVYHQEIDYRIELLQRWPQGDYKPRIYKQETVLLPGQNEMLVWREYEMGYRAQSDPDLAVKLALSVIKYQNGR